MADKKAKAMSKSALFEAVTKEAGNNLTKRQVRNVVDALTSVAYKELKKSGIFAIPGLAKMTVVKKPATKARQGINPFTKEPMMIKAKPARKAIRVRAVKAAKDAVA